MKENQKGKKKGKSWLNMRTVMNDCPKIQNEDEKQKKKGLTNEASTPPESAEAFSVRQEVEVEVVQ